MPATPTLPTAGRPAEVRASGQPLSPRLQRWLGRAAHFRRSPAHGYGIALGLFGVALAVRFAVDPALGVGFPFLTFFPAILLAAVLGGRGPGTLCALLCVLAAWYWFIAPRHSFALDGQGAVAVAFFTAIAVVDVLIIDVMVRALEQLEAEKATSQALAEQRTTLFHELQHRVANNLMLASSLMLTQQKRLAHNPEAVAALGAARQQFTLMSRIHRRLHDPAHARLPFGEALQDLCREMLQAAQARDVAVQVRSADVAFDMDRSITLSLLTLELVTNAVKHAFAPGQPGLIEVTLTEPAPGRCLLCIRDNGRGLPAGFNPEAGDRLGMRIVRGFVAALQGELQIDTDPARAGTRVQVRFDSRAGG